MLTFLLTITIVLLIAGVGTFVSHLLFGLENSSTWLLASPILGLSVLILLVQNGYLFGAPVSRIAAPMVVLSAVSAVGTLRLRAKLNLPITVDSLGRFVPLFAAVGMISAGWAGFYVGHKTYMDFAYPDANNYQFSADRLLNSASSDPLLVDGYHPGNYHIREIISSHDRTGAEAYLAWVSAFLDLNTKQAYFIAIMVLVFLAPFSVCLFAAEGLGMSSSGAKLAAFLSAMSSLLALVAHQQFLGHLTGVVIAPAALGFFARAIRRNDLRSVLAASILSAALASFYPEILFFFVVPAAAMIALYCALAVQSYLVVAKLSAATIAMTFACNPVYVAYAVGTALVQSGRLPGGGMYDFSFSATLLPVLFGFTPYPLGAATGAISLTYYRTAMAIAIVVVSGVFAHLIWSSADGARKLLYAAMASIVPLLSYLLYIRFSYGFFKLFLYSHFLLLTLIAGILLDISAGRAFLRRLPRATRRFVVLSLCSLFMFCNLASSAWYGKVSLGAADHGIVNQTGLSGDPSFEDLEGLEHLIRSNESVMVDTSTGTEQMWAAFGLRHVRISLPQPLLYFASYANQDFAHGFTDRFLLQDAAEATDIITECTPRKPIWRTRRFVLTELHDHISLGQNWYGLEGTPPKAYRWMNNDAELILVGSGEQQYRLIFDAIAGPGVSSPVRHIQILVNGSKVHEQTLDGQAHVATGPFQLAHRDNLVVIHTDEIPQPLVVNDPRSMDMFVSGITACGEESFAARRTIENPSDIRADEVLRHLDKMTGIYSDLWVAPEASIDLGNPGRATAVILEGTVPTWSKFVFPLRIVLRAGGESIGSVMVAAPGPFQARLSLPRSMQNKSNIILSLSSKFSFTPSEMGTSTDGRKLSFMYVRMAVVK
jgi:hypothetical protein